MNADLAIGVGARRGVNALELVTLVRECVERFAPEREREKDWRLFTIDTKQDEAGLHEAARLLRAEIVFLPLEALLARKDDVLTRSLRVEALTGVGSVAEAAALAGAGPGSRLLGPRIATRTLTCAIAQQMLDDTQ
jgi:cobalt-precorrin 5A hydrolase